MEPEQDISLREPQVLTLFDQASRDKSKRRCGDCQLCCKLLAVKALNKPNNTKCVHQKFGKGCTIYHNRGENLPAIKQAMRAKGLPVPDGDFATPLPTECDLWSCRWLTDADDTAALARPDRSHYVIDPMPDMMVLQSADGSTRELTVGQIWVDPRYPDAHRDPALRAYVAMIAERDGMPFVVRRGGNDFVLVAPSLASDGIWHEKPTSYLPSTGSGNRFVDMLQRGS